VEILRQRPPSLCHRPMWKRWPPAGNTGRNACAAVRHCSGSCSARRALRRTVGSRQVQRGQRLRELAELPNVTAQVMPLSGGAHTALGISFVLLDLGQSRTVYMEGLTSSDYLVRPQHIPDLQSRL
jgi:hypothetical protein